jgi:myo-inositol-1(or 4)-monophosphatase
MTATTRRMIAVQIAQEAAVMARGYFAALGSLSATTKNPGDFVSVADVQVEQFIRGRLADHFPGESILGEEQGGDVGRDCWVIDPIDGTANFLRGLPLWGVMLAHVSDQRADVGVIILPMLGVELSAAAGEGFWSGGARQDRRVHQADARVAAMGDNRFWEYDQRMLADHTLRQAGYGIAGYRSASVSLAYVAMGLTDGYVENCLSLWDLAAGDILCREAGLQSIHNFSTAPQCCFILVGDAPFMAALKPVIFQTPGLFAG